MFSVETCNIFSVKLFWNLHSPLHPSAHSTKRRNCGCETVGRHRPVTDRVYFLWFEDFFGYWVGPLLPGCASKGVTHHCRRNRVRYFKYEAFMKQRKHYCLLWLLSRVICLWCVNVDQRTALSRGELLPSCLWARLLCRLPHRQTWDSDRHHSPSQMAVTQIVNIWRSAVWLVGGVSLTVYPANNGQSQFAPGTQAYPSMLSLPSFWWDPKL